MLLVYSGMKEKLILLRDLNKGIQLIHMSTVNLCVGGRRRGGERDRQTDKGIRGYKNTHRKSEKRENIVIY